MKKVFSVWVQNLAYYNEGKIVGGWIDLPQTKEKIDEYLKDIVKIDKMHEEYEIADIDDYPFEYKTVQWESLYKINNLATIYSELTQDNKEKIFAYIDANITSDVSIDELINLCLQVDDIPYYSYYFDGMEYSSSYSNELKMGYTMAEQTGLYSELERLGIVDFFDFEKYGETYGYDFVLFENGYIDNNEKEIDLEFYGKDEIKEKVEEILVGYEQEKEKVELEI